MIGNGNVAIDVARMLVLTPEELAPTDTADHALEVLAASQRQRGRRRRPPRARTGRVHQPRAAGARRADRRRRDRRRGRARARARGARRAGRAGRDRAAQRRDPARVRRSRAVRASASASCCASSPLQSALMADERGHLGAVELVRNELVSTDGGRLRAQATEERETLAGRARLPRDRLPRHPAPARAVRRARRRDPERGRARARPRVGAGRSPASTWSAGSSAGPRA